MKGDQICVVPGCGRPRHSYDWCRAHYNRWNRHATIYAHIPIGDRHNDGPPGNPWAGRTPCPQCHTDRWTMPRGGGWDDTAWVCVNRFDHPTVFFAVEAAP